MAYVVEQGNGWRLLLGSCFDLITTLEPVDHVITDPPYEIEAHSKARRALKDGTRKSGGVNRGEVRRIDEPLEISFPSITESERSQAAKLFSGFASRWVIVFCQIEGITPWRTELVAAGLEWVRGGVWRKPDGAPQFTGDRPGQGFECLAIAHPPGRKRWNGGGKHAVWTHTLQHERGVASAGKADHPTVKPTALMMDLVSDFTDAGETVLDPFAGSGTTGVACLRLGRRFVGIERDPKYFKLACDRLRAEEQGSTLQAARAGQVALFGGGR